MSAKQKAHNKILKYLKNKEIFSIYKDFKKLLKASNSYAVAVSGGPDSLALAYFCKCFSLQNKTKLPIAVVRAFLEITVVSIGWYLGGTVGFGTLMFAFGVGPAVALGLFLVNKMFS